MDAIQRRVFLKGASMGMLAFTVGGTNILMTSGEARARAVPFRLLNTEEAETLEALGEALVPGAREAGIAHFIDQQLSVPPGESLLHFDSDTPARKLGTDPRELAFKITNLEVVVTPSDGPR